MKIAKKILWIVKRHPFLYYARFKLLSHQATTEEMSSYSYNLLNPKNDIPSSFFIVNSIIFNGKPKNTMTNMDKVLKVASWLRVKIKGGSGLSLSSERALLKMLEGEGGVCSDMAQIFNNFCVVNDIKVREWGITSLPFSSNFGGHAFNEFYSSELKKWVLIDVSKSLLFYLKNSSEPLSVMELFQYNNEGFPIIFKSFLDTNPINKDYITYYYLKATREPFLICNYHNETYDKYLDRFQAILPIFVIHFWLYLFKKSYYYLFPFRDIKTELMYNS